MEECSRRAPKMEWLSFGDQAFRQVSNTNMTWKVLAGNTRNIHNLIRATLYCWCLAFTLERLIRHPVRSPYSQSPMAFIFVVGFRTNPTTFLDVGLVISISCQVTCDGWHIWYRNLQLFSTRQIRRLHLSTHRWWKIFTVSTIEMRHR